jgi:hypothetical protein
MFDLDSTLQQIASIVVAKALEKAQARTEIEPDPVAGTAEAAGEARHEDGFVGSGSLGRVPRHRGWEVLGARRKG